MLKKYLHSLVVLFTTPKIWKQLKPPKMKEWIKKVLCVCVCACIKYSTVKYVHNETLFSHKNKEFLPFVTTWIDIESIMLSEIKTNMISLICRILKNKT